MMKLFYEGNIGIFQEITMEDLWGPMTKYGMKLFLWMAPPSCISRQKVGSSIMHHAQKGVFGLQLGTVKDAAAAAEKSTEHLVHLELRC